MFRFNKFSLKWSQNKSFTYGVRNGRELELILWTIFIAGVLKAYLLPAIALVTGIGFIHIPDWISTPGIGHAMTVCMGILPLVGIIDFYSRGGRLERRKPKKIHLLFLVLMFLGALLAPLERILVRGDEVSQVLWTLSDTLPSGIAFGLLVPFYKLEKEKRLLSFLFFFALTYITVPAAATVKILNPSLSGFPTYETPFYLDAWFWSDMIVNIGVGVFLIWSILNEHLLRKRTTTRVRRAGVAGFGKGRRT